ncbi:MAG: methanol dehydrogenase regulatory protein [Candidatus Methanoperedens nitroreducens]|uniref:Methanol dehydrogenase regulatory protein n=1 Tax=Candidatus Methanoperedens nitratireducens TaxID=1392998 RepID=A0A0P8AGG5_9EURY|nr:MoxR family ATPase [Candidatus Methanoperedens sp. BLZ2]KAB2948072.1 MAG: MoxR family ATPase [Candidatus Methanoperedens sp.]KPQ43463.1 MAG: methanol dehydrogenase regulatory protein [Candidatus Methanoperedens sp. BLZ1]MBZ0173874.1 MoxR family ATPase [Candidatus Methanoperedens nitroreducens]MCX9080142.1 MoxR family ATPase [Candidatus Methanoperedens sp.]
MSNETYTSSTRIFKELLDEIGKVVVGQHEAVEHMMIAILCNSHALVESNPGLAKTLTISTISKALDLKFNRIQCTPDLMPSDITGTYIIEDIGGKKQYRFEPGPVFANIVLADEINRASPKTQSALLEAMQEKQVTVGNKTYMLDKPFFILATQNPIEMEGTYPLPEAQLDRFLLKILMDYPTFEDENEIVNRYTKNIVPSVKSVVSKTEVLELQKLTRDVPIAEDIKVRAIKIVGATRGKSEHIEYGASPRASIGIILAAKARALMKGRNYVSKEDIDVMAYPVLRHRIILTFESERKGMTTDQVISDLIKNVK